MVVAVDPAMRTLLDHKRRPHIKAGRGEHGKGKNKTGASGADAVIRVPAGTTIHDAETGEVLADLTAAGERAVVARGGRGGRGNARFATSTNQAPREWEPGEQGEERILRLELRLIADIGLVGLPNAGKSTLLSRVTAARPKIAAYPFTTLEPNLGIARLGDVSSCVIADIPGLIEGASTGKGLGLEFLRHIERTRALLYLVDISGDAPAAELEVLRAELIAHSPALGNRPSALLLTKLDLVPPSDRAVHLELRDIPNGVLPEQDSDLEVEFAGLSCLAISAQSGEGLEQVARTIVRLLEEAASNE